MSQLVNPMARFWRLASSFRKEIGQLYFYAFLNGLVGLSLPLGMQAIIQFLMAGQISTSLVLLVLLVVGGLLISGWMQILQLTVSEHIQQQIFARGAFDICFRIPRIRLEKLAGKYFPEMMNRFFDVVGIQKGLSKVMIDFTTASLQVILGLILLSIYHPFFIAFSLILIFLLYLLFRLTSPQGMKTSLKASTYKYRVANWLEEMARSVATFKLAGNTGFPQQKIDDEVDNYLEARIKHFQVLKVQYWSMVLLKVLIAFTLLLLGSYLVTDEQLNLGQFVAAEIIILLVLNAVEKILINMDTIYDLLTSLEKVGTISDLELEAERLDTLPLNANNIPIEVHINNVGFKYDKNETSALNHLDLDISSGEKIAIYGPSGGGKSTLLKLLSGIYQVQSGKISLNNLAINSIDHAALNRWIGQCMNTESIFNGSILENIDLGRGLPFGQIRETASLVGLDNYLDAFPEGLATILQSDGSPLSRSVSKRIILARSLACKPALLLYEDLFAELSASEKASLYKCILSGPWTLIAFTNDELLINQMDRKILLEKGSFVSTN